MQKNKVIYESIFYNKERYDKTYKYFPHNSNPLYIFLFLPV